MNVVEQHNRNQKNDSARIKGVFSASAPKLRSRKPISKIASKNCQQKLPVGKGMITNEVVKPLSKSFTRTPLEVLRKGAEPAAD